MWDIVREFAVDASQQELLRTTLHHWLLIYQNMRRAWNEIVSGALRAARLRLAAARRRRFQTGDEQTYDELEDELGEFCLALTRPTETAFGLLLSGKASLEATKELVKDFIHLDATRNIAGQFTRLVDGRRSAPSRRRSRPSRAAI